MTLVGYALWSTGWVCAAIAVVHRGGYFVAAFCLWMGAWPLIFLS